MTADASTPTAPSLRLATRRSPQASTQARLVAEAIAARTGRSVELVFVDTTGDRRRDVPLHTIGGLGVFTKEVQAAVVDGRADAAVHSAKDLPTAAVDGLTIAAFCERRDPADVLVGRRLDELAAGATVASGSVRRRAELAVLRPDLHFVELRGNIGRRLEQLPAGGALVMAAAALHILGLDDRIAERLDPASVIPAVGQGCVAVECRADDAATRNTLAAVDHAPTRAAVLVERAFLAALGTGCSLPIAAHSDGATLRTFVAATDELVPGQAPTATTEVLELTGEPSSDAALAQAAATRQRHAARW